MEVEHTSTPAATTTTVPAPAAGEQPHVEAMVEDRHPHLQPSSVSTGGGVAGVSGATGGEQGGEGGGGVERGEKVRVYVAGKMMFLNAPERDWRGLLRFRELDWSAEQGPPLLERLLQLRDLELEWDDHWTYVGPHFLHPLAASSPHHHPHHHHLPHLPPPHGGPGEVDYFYQLDDDPRSGAVLAAVLPRDEQRDVTVDEREKQAILDNARHQIAKCDVLYARLPEHKDSYWTFIEIGMAAALGKRVYVDCPVESHDTWLLPLLSDQTKTSREEYLSLPWALYKH